jgi:hypothetical protein
MTTRKRKALKTAPQREPLTAPVEDYLKAIYAIERAGGPAATNDIAQHLEIAPASVSGSRRGAVLSAFRFRVVMRRVTRARAAAAPARWPGGEPRSPRSRGSRRR